MVYIPPPPGRFRYRSERRLAGGPGEDVVDQKLIHLFARVYRRRTEMRQQHDVRHRQQLFRNFRLFGEDVQPGCHDLSLAERRDQSGLVDDRAARNVDQNTLGSESFQHRGIDHVFGRGAAGHDDNERVHVARHVDELRVMPIGKLGPLVPRVVGDRHAERFQPAGDRYANAPHAEQADAAVAQRRPAQRIVAFRPFAGAQIPLGLRQLAHRAKEEAERGVGDLLGKHVGSMGDDDAAFAGRDGVDVVIAHPET